MKTTIYIALTAIMALSCTEPIGPCYSNEQHCRELLKQMNKATSPKEKEQIRQFYLAEKNLLEACQRQNGK